MLVDGLGGGHLTIVEGTGAGHLPTKIARKIGSDTDIPKFGLNIFREILEKSSKCLQKISKYLQNFFKYLKISRTFKN